MSYPLIYKDKKMDIGYRIDLIVEEKVIIEVKSVDVLNPVHMASNYDLPQAIWLPNWTAYQF